MLSKIGKIEFLVLVAIISLIPAQSFSEIKADSIVLALPFEGNAKDLSDNGTDGEVEGGAKFVDGKIGKAVELDGKDDVVKINKKIGALEEVSFVHWVNSTGRDAQWRVFFNNNGWKAGDIHYQLHPNKQIEFSIHGNPGGNDTFAKFMITGKEMNKWVHVATVYSAKEKKIWFYVNGKLDVENKWGGNPGVLDKAGIGGWDGQRQWQGLLDEFIIFTTVLEEKDIQTLMDEGIEKTLSIQPGNKVATTWASIRNVN